VRATVTSRVTRWHGDVYSSWHARCTFITCNNIAGPGFKFARRWSGSLPGGVHFPLQLLDDYVTRSLSFKFWELELEV
jgi:hypothetical protein